MPAGITPQQTTSVPTEDTSPIVGSAPGTVLLAEVMKLFSAALNTVVARQVMVIGDPVSAPAVAEVSNLVPDGTEFAISFRLSPGSPELQAILAEARMLRAEMQQLLIQLGALPLTPKVIEDQTP